MSTISVWGCRPPNGAKIAVVSFCATESKHSRIELQLPAIVFGRFALYVYSLGLYVLLTSRGLISPAISRIIGFAFLPLGLLHEYVPPIGDLLDWYIELWWSP